MAAACDVIVIGQIARDLVLSVDTMPEAGTGASVRRRRELLGGKGANQAVGLAQLGVRSALLGIVGQDRMGRRLLDQAHRDDIDVSAVRRRGRSALIVDIVDDQGRWRYLEDIPDESVITEADVVTAGDLIGQARWASVQLQQPPAAVRAAVEVARKAGCRILIDGAPEKDLPPQADVWRADAREAEILVGHQLRTWDDGIDAARDLLGGNLSLIAFALKDLGNLLVWPTGEIRIPHADVEVVDTTGAGDAFIAGLIASLLRSEPPEVAGRRAAMAAAATVGHPGGRPSLSLPQIFTKVN